MEVMVMKGGGVVEGRDSAWLSLSSRGALEALQRTPTRTRAAFGRPAPRPSTH